MHALLVWKWNYLVSMTDLYQIKNGNQAFGSVRNDRVKFFIFFLFRKPEDRPFSREGAAVLTAVKPIELITFARNS